MCVEYSFLNLQFFLSDFLIFLLSFDSNITCDAMPIKYTHNKLIEKLQLVPPWNQSNEIRSLHTDLKKWKESFFFCLNIFN